jgi:hypothetical protein
MDCNFLDQRKIATAVGKMKKLGPPVIAVLPLASPHNFSLFLSTQHN